MSNTTLELERSIRAVNMLLYDLRNYELIPGKYIHDDDYARIVDSELQPLIEALKYNIRKVGPEELVSLVDSLDTDKDFDGMKALKSIEHMIEPEVSSWTKTQQAEIDRRYNAASSRLAHIYGKRMGSINWKDLLRRYIGSLDNVDSKSRAITVAISRDHNNFEAVVGALLKSHQTSELHRTRLNDMLRPLGYEITESGALGKVEAELGLAEMFGAVADDLATKMVKQEVSKPNFTEFEYHRQRVSDAYYRLDWKTFSAELRNVLEAWMKCLDNWNRQDEFKMPEALNRVIGSKDWKRDVVYGVYRLVSGEGSHSGIPNKELCLTAYHLLVPVLKVMYGLKS